MQPDGVLHSLRGMRRSLRGKLCPDNILRSPRGLRRPLQGHS